VFSGGEPTLQKGLAAALGEVRDMGFKTALHSAGPYPRRLQELLPLLDWVGLDIKTLPQDYPSITGVPGSGEQAWESARRLIASGVDHEIRLTVHPAWLSYEALQKTVYRLRSLGANRVILQQGRTEHTLDRELSNRTLVSWDNYPDHMKSTAWTRETAPNQVPPA